MRRLEYSSYFQCEYIVMFSSLHFVLTILESDRYKWRVFLHISIPSLSFRDDTRFFSGGVEGRLNRKDNDL